MPGFPQLSGAYVPRIAGTTSVAAPLPFYNVKDYGAKGDGTTDDTTAIQAAINAAMPTAGTVVFPPGNYLVSSTLTIQPSASSSPVPTVSLVSQTRPGRIGDASDTSAVIITCSGTFTSGTFVIDYLPPSSTSAPTGAVFSGIGINCASRGAGVRIVQPRSFFVSNVTVDHPVNPTGNPDGCTGGFNVVSRTATAGAYNVFQGIVVTSAGNDGIVHNGANEDIFLGTFVLNPTRYSYNCQGSATWIKPHYEGGQFGFYIFPSTAGGGQMTFIGATYFMTPSSAAVQYQGTPGGHLTQFIGCFFTNTPGASPGEEAGSVIDLQVGGSSTYNILFSGCEIAATTNTTDWVIAPSTATGTAIFRDCSFTGTPTTHKFNQASNSVLRFYGCPGINPMGHSVTQPSVPASTTAQTNSTGVDCTVFVTGGTVSAIAIGGTATGLTSGAFRVPSGQTITLTYTVAPTWQWFGD